MTQNCEMCGQALRQWEHLPSSGCPLTAGVWQLWLQVVPWNLAAEGDGQSPDPLPLGGIKEVLGRWAVSQ